MAQGTTMQELAFKKSELGSIGVEVELQIVDNNTFKLTSWAKEILDHFDDTRHHDRINHEITQGMVEINTNVHTCPEQLYDELTFLQNTLIKYSKGKNFSFCGGGTHPFQDWHDQKIFPDERYQKVLQRFQFLCKQATIFGQHVHFGCETTEQAIYLTHALAQYTPLLIALSSSSPFYQGVDSGFCSSRNTQFNAFPICGYMPFFKDWDEFSDYFYHLKNLGLIESMKDVYWDVRPKPEFGTVEVRILDTPLTLRKAAALSAFIQALGLYLIDQRPIQLTKEMYYLYGCNRFEASRYGLDGYCSNGDIYKNHLIKKDLIDTFNVIEPYANKDNQASLFQELKESVHQQECDALYLRDVFNKEHSLERVVEKQCEIWVTPEKGRL